MLLLARRGESAGDGDEDDLLVLELCSLCQPTLELLDYQKGGGKEVCTLAGVVLGRQSADGQVERAGGRDVGEGHAGGEGVAGVERGHFVCVLVWLIGNWNGGKGVFWLLLLG